MDALHSEAIAAGIMPSTPFLDDVQSWLASSYAQTEAMSALFFLEASGHLDSSGFQASAVAALRNAMSMEQLNRTVDLSAKYAPQWSDEKAKEFWEGVSKASRGMARAKVGTVVKAEREVLDRVPERFRGIHWLDSAKVVPDQTTNHWMLLLAQHRARNPGEDVSRWDDEAVRWVEGALRQSLASDKPTPHAVLALMADEHYRKQILSKMPEAELDNHLIAIARFADNWEGIFPEKLIYLEKLGLLERYWKENGHSLFHWGTYSNATPYSAGLVQVLKHPDLSEKARTTIRTAARKLVKEHFKSFIRVGTYDFSKTRYTDFDRISDLNNPHLPELMGDVLYSELLSELKSNVRGFAYLKLTPHERERVANHLRALALGCDVAETAATALDLLKGVGWLKPYLSQETVAAFEKRWPKAPAPKSTGCLLSALRRWMAKTPGSLR